MVYQSGPQFTAFDYAGRCGLRNVENEPGRWFHAAGQLPSQDIQQSESLRRIRIVEALSVEVLRKWRPRVGLDQFSISELNNFR
jgi:hypothetical protein